MKQRKMTFAQMHADHRRWQSDDAFWCDETENWRSKCIIASSRLAAIQEAIERYDQRLADHAEQLVRQTHSYQEHEKAMAACQKEGADFELQEAMIANHRHQTLLHEQIREKHQQLKQQHDGLLGSLMNLMAQGEDCLPDY